MDFTNYVPPGVYVSDATVPPVTVSGLPGSALVIVGPALGYRTTTESIQAFMTSGSYASLSHRGATTTAVTGPPAVAAPVVTTQAGVTLVVGTDYNWVVDTSGGGGAPNAVVSLQRLNSGATSDGDFLLVTYQYTDSLYFTPQIFTDYDTIESVYGQAVVGVAPTNPNDTQVVSPISLAAQIAYQNGATQVMALALNPADGTMRQQFVAAYAKLLADYRVGVIVPLFVASGTDFNPSTGVYTPFDYGSNTNTPASYQGFVTDLQNHLVASAADGFGRIALCGMTRNYDITTLTIDALAISIDYKRIALVYPNREVYYNGLINQTSEVDGFYLAAALGGILLSNPVQRGLTKQIASGFVGIPSAIFQQMTRTYKDLLSKSGVLVVEQDRQSRMSVRHGVSTDMSSMITRELSLTRISDSLFASIQSGMDGAGLIGDPIDNEMPTLVKGALSGILETAVANSTIVAYANLVVRQQSIGSSGDPTIIDCKFSYQPAVPLNYITVSFTLDLTTGTAIDTSTVTQ